jgi:hypothetical protein
VRLSFALGDGRETPLPRRSCVRACRARRASGLDGEAASSLDPHSPPLLADHGVEPLAAAFTADALRSLIAHRATRIKSLLLDQRCIVGIGNIYADEALWRAQIHPLTPANRLRPEQLTALHHAIVGVLSEAVAARGSSINDYTAPDGDGEMQERLDVYQRTGEPCHRCGAAIQRVGRWRSGHPRLPTPASERHAAQPDPWRRAPRAVPAGVSESPQRRSVQHEASVLPRVDDRRAKGRRHEHHYAERCSSRDRRRRHP